MKSAAEEKIVQTPEEAAFIERFTADYCRPHRAVVATRLAAFVRTRQMRWLASAGAGFARAAGDSAPAASVEAPDEEVRFIFASEGEGETVSAAAWRAELVVPPKATAETMLALAVTDGAGSPAAGIFTVAGVSLPLAAGRAEIPFGLFLAGIKNTDVNLRPPQGTKVAGRLLFF